MRPAILILLVSSALRAEPPALDPYGDRLPEGATSRIGSLGDSAHGLVGVAITPDGGRFVCGTNAALVVRDTRTFAKIRTIRLNWDGNHRHVAISADGKRVAAILHQDGNQQRKVAIVWDVSSGEQLCRVELKKDDGNLRDYALALTSDGKRLAAMGCLVDVDGKRVAHEMPFHFAKSRPEFVAGDKYLIDNASYCYLWREAATGKEIRCESGSPKAEGSSRRIAPDGKSLFFVEDGDLVRMTVEFPTPDRPTMKFSSPKRFPVQDARGIARVGEKGDRCLLWRDSAERGSSLLLFDFDAGKVIDEVAFGADTWQDIHAATLTENGALLLVEPGYKRMLRAKLVALGMPGGKDLAAERGLKFLDGELTWMPDSKRLRTEGQLWDARSGKYLGETKPEKSPRESWEPPPDPQWVYPRKVASPQGNLAVAMPQRPVTMRIAPPSRCELQVWDTVANRKLHCLRESDVGHLTLNVRGLSRDGEVFAQDEGRALFVWETRSGRLIAREELVPPDDSRHMLPLISPSGQQLVCVPGGQLLLYDIASRGPALELKLDLPPHQEVSDLDWSPDGRFVALIVPDDELQVYDLHRAKLVWKKPTSQNDLRDVRFSPDGRAILTQDRLYGLVWPAPVAEPFFQPLKEAEFAAAWERLLASRADECRETCLRLAASGEAAAKFLDGKLEAAPGIPPERFDALLARLRGDDFRKRAAAEKELRELEEYVLPRLKKALETEPADADLTERLNRLIEAGRGISPPHSAQTLRKLRAVAALEAIRTDSARETLERLARGAEESAVTREARAVLKRTE